MLLCPATASAAQRPHLEARQGLHEVQLVVVGLEALEAAGLANAQLSAQLGFVIRPAAQTTCWQSQRRGHVSAVYPEQPGRTVAAHCNQMRPVLHAYSCKACWRSRTGIHCCGKRLQRKEQPKHHLLVIAEGSSAVPHRLWARPLIVEQAGALPVEDVHVVAHLQHAEGWGSWHNEAL